MRLYKTESHSDYYGMLNCSICKYVWAGGLRRCDQNRKIPSSNFASRSAGLRDPTWLRGSSLPSGGICKRQVINIE